MENTLNKANMKHIKLSVKKTLLPNSGQIYLEIQLAHHSDVNDPDDKYENITIHTFSIPYSILNSLPTESLTILCPNSVTQSVPSLHTNAIANQTSIHNTILVDYHSSCINIKNTNQNK